MRKRCHVSLLIAAALLCAALPAAAGDGAGIELTDDIDLSIDGSIRTRFEFPDQQEYSLTAQVIWAKKVPPELAHTLSCGMGVRFVNPGADWPDSFEKWHAKKTG